MKGRTAAAALAAIAWLAACGSTVPLDGQSAANAGGDLAQGDGLSLSTATEGASAASASALGTDGQPATAAASPVSPGTPGTTTQQGATTQPGTVAAPVASANAQGGEAAAQQALGPGVTATEIAIGVDYIKGAEQVAEAFGVEGLATGDARAQAKAIIKAVNAEGGIAGRKVVPVFHGRDASRGAQNPDVLDQEACTAFTQDSKVFAVISYQNATEGYMRCLYKAGVILVDDAIFTDTALARDLAGFMYMPGYWLSDEIITIEIDRLAATGWLNAKSVVGLHYWDMPVQHRLVKTVVKPALARHGLQVADEVAIAPTADGLSSYSGAVLQFRAAGIDRVLDILVNPLFFMQAAEPQGYRPGWSVNSGFGPGALLQTAAPREQLTDVAGIGWSPWSDVDAQHNPGPVNSNETRCFKIMKEAGQEAPEGTTKLFQLQLCDSLFFMQRTLQQPDSATPAGLAAAANALGDRYRSPVAYATKIRPGVPAGGAAVRDLAYSTDCSCFEYRSKPIRVF